MTKPHTTEAVNEMRKRMGKLADLSDGYRLAVEAYRLATDLGCSGDLYDALWSLVEREAAQVEARTAEKH